MRYNEQYIGWKFKVNGNELIEVIAGTAKRNKVLVRFDDNGEEMEVTLRNIKEQKIWRKSVWEAELAELERKEKEKEAKKFEPVVCGVGYIGVGVFKSTSHKNAYNTWGNMMKRCYSKGDGWKSYEGCEICEEWHNFQNFAMWHRDNYKEGWQIDKDLFAGDNKVYSPTVCVYLPQVANVFLANNKKKKTEKERIDAAEEMAKRLRNEFNIRDTDVLDQVKQWF